MKKPTVNSINRKFKTLQKTIKRLEENIESHQEHLSDALVESEQTFIKNIEELSQVIDSLDKNSSEEELSTSNEKVLSATEFCDKMHECNDYIAESVKDFNTYVTSNKILNESVSDDAIHTVSKMKTIGQKMSNTLIDKISKYNF